MRASRTKGKHDSLSVDQQCTSDFPVLVKVLVLLHGVITLDKPIRAAASFVDVGISIIKGIDYFL